MSKTIDQEVADAQEKLNGLAAKLNIGQKLSGDEAKAAEAALIVVNEAPRRKRAEALWLHGLSSGAAKYAAGLNLPNAREKAPEVAASLSNLSDGASRFAASLKLPGVA